MSDLKSVLDRGLHGFEPSTEALDVTLDKVTRRRRNRRLAAASVAIVIAVAAVGGGLSVLDRSIERPVSRVIDPDTVGSLTIAWHTTLDGPPATMSFDSIAHTNASHWPDPILFPPVAAGDTVLVASRTGTLYALPASCGSDAATCAPMWTATTDSTITYPPTVSGGRVFVATDDAGVQAYPIACASDGGTCQPSWVGALGLPASQPVVGGGLVYAVDAYKEELVAFPVDCATDGRTCDPLWRENAGAPWPADARTPKNWPYTPVVADGAVYVVGATHQVYAFDAIDGRPLWRGRTGWNSVGGSRYSQVAVSGGEVFATAGTRLFAFDEGCATDGQWCRPVWIGTTSDTLVMTAPVVMGDVVYVGTASNGHTGHVEAFTTRCGSGGRVCRPLWVARAEGETTTLLPVVSESGIYITSGIRGFTQAFRLRCSTPCRASWRAAPLLGLDQRGLSQPPLVYGDLVFVGHGTDIEAFDRACTSKGRTCTTPLWTWSVPNGSGIASTPTIVGGRLVVVTSAGEVFTFTADGRSE